MAAIPSAREALSKLTVPLRHDADVFEAIETLVKKGVTGAPVIDEHGELVGVLTAKDCLRVLSNASWEEVPGGKVLEYMSEPTTVIDADFDLLAAADRFLETNFPVLPLLEGKKLIGKVRRPELLERLCAFGAQLEKERARQIKRLQRKGGDPTALARLEAASTLEELVAALEP